jgi:AcrR family transcriptional regulator
MTKKGKGGASTSRLARHKAVPRTARRFTPPSPYHHGNLRSALLAATEAVLEDVGLEGFTLREVARRAGVSHGAPAHHFHDVTGLLSAFTAESFEQLADAMAVRRAVAGRRPFDQLVATGIGYVEYALFHRARFQLMFRSDRLNSSHPPLAQAGARAYGELTDCIEALARAGGGKDTNTVERTALAWSIVHGFATLMIDNQGFAEKIGGDRDRAVFMVESILRLSRPAFVGGG